MAKFTWTGLGGAEEGVAASRLISQVNTYVPNITAFDYQTIKDAILAEAVSAIPTLITPSEAVLVSGIDASTGNSLTVTLTAARAVGAPLNPTTGQRFTFVFIQDGTGGRAVTWNAVFKTAWADTGNTLNKRSSVSFIYDGTNWNQDGAQSPYI